MRVANGFQVVTLSVQRARIRLAHATVPRLLPYCNKALDLTRTEQDAFSLNRYMFDEHVVKDVYSIAGTNLFVINRSA